MDGQREKVVVGQVPRVRHQPVDELWGIGQADVIRPEMMIGGLNGAMEATGNVLDGQATREEGCDMMRMQAFSVSGQLDQPWLRLPDSQTCAF